MRKFMLFRGLVIMLFLITAGCSEDKTTVTDNAQDQVVLATVQDYYTPGKASEPPKIYASVFSNPLTEVKYCKINDTSFEGADFFDYGYGCCSLNLTGEQQTALNIDNSVEFEMSTELGKVGGSITKPSPVTGPMINGAVPDYEDVYQFNVVSSDDIILSWTYGTEKPNYVMIQVQHTWYDHDTYETGQTDFYRSIPNTETSYTIFKAGEIPPDGDIYIWISSVNGPDKSNDGVSNLTGDGSGSIHWISDSELNELYIQVGEAWKSGNDVNENGGYCNE